MAAPGRSTGIYTLVAGRRMDIGELKSFSCGVPDEAPCQGTPIGACVDGQSPNGPRLLQDSRTGRSGGFATPSFFPCRSERPVFSYRARRAPPCTAHSSPPHNVCMYAVVLQVQAVPPGGGMELALSASGIYLERRRACPPSLPCRAGPRVRTYVVRVEN
ncbi:hypothetical protein BDY21DRAFT_107599 [Lineolata rhizophorae]|uniref:Uncharacterized protein n=1 Tax=Lineolata rhizophorae TaxID=578093 RepID=A0A6A6NQY9_9PEZI|nr:hypothetical protein BDY21DRAFT_107599 [Lineolata rhizophorae]